METIGYDEVRDFVMSEKFGLDWKKHDSKRMEALYTIIQLRAEREERERKKSAKIKS